MEHFESITIKFCRVSEVKQKCLKFILKSLSSHTFPFSWTSEYQQYSATMLSFINLPLLIFIQVKIKRIENSENLKWSKFSFPYLWS